LIGIIFAKVTKEIRKQKKEKEENKIKIEKGRREQFGPVSESARIPGRKPEPVPSVLSLPR
jgi:hypothetical protein